MERNVRKPNVFSGDKGTAGLWLLRVFCRNAAKRPSDMTIYIKERL